MFQLSDYLPEIRAIAEKKKCTEIEAVDCMIVNLNTFNEYHVGTGTLSYRQLGHEWGDLTSAQKVAQNKEAKQLLQMKKGKRNGR